MDPDKLTKIFCTYGFVNQALKTIEEMEELAQAITEYLSEPAYEKVIHLAEEVGDVLIMAEQLRRMVGAQCVDEWMDFKLERTINRIERGEKDAGNWNYKGYRLVGSGSVTDTWCKENRIIEWFY